VNNVPVGGVSANRHHVVMSLKIALAVAVLCAACEASIGGSAALTQPDAADSDGTPVMIDASTGTVTPDAPDVVPRCSGRVVYLNFEGVTLTRATSSDSTMNRASWIGVTTANVPPYRAAAGDRTQQIQAVTNRITSALSSFPVTVTRIRPTTGQYVMIAFGGDGDDVASQYGYATSFHDCGDLVKNDVAWVSDDVPTAKVGDYAIGAIGWGLGLNGTNSITDCMCGWSNNCQQSNTLCTLSSSIATTPMLAPEVSCPGLATQNEVQAFDTAFCQ
jgi:hypothetical protein